MNKCHMVKELGSYLDNQLSDHQRQRMDGHLKTCKICTQELARLKTLSEKIKAWHTPDLEAGFDVSLRNKIVAWELQRGQVKMKKKTFTVLVPSGVLAGILVLLFMWHAYFPPALYHKTVQYSQDKKFAPAAYLSTRSAIPMQITRGAYQNKVLGGGGDKIIEELGDNRYQGALGLSQADKYGNALGDRIQTYDGHMREYDARRVYGLSEKDEASARGGNMMMAYSQPYPQTQETKTPVESFAPIGEGSVIVIQPVLPATGEGEKIIRAAEIALEVEDGREAYKSASLICQELSGYLATSNFYKDNEGRESGTIVMRIPKDKFTHALDRLGTLGKVENIVTDSRDVSQEYANIKAQLDAAMVVYNKMLEALQKRQTTIPEAMRLESEITPILQRVEGLKNQLEYLNNAVALTTITVRFHEPAVSAKILKESRRYIQESILNAKINAVKFFAGILPYTVVIVTLLAVALGLAIFLTYWLRRLFKS